MNQLDTPRTNAAINASGGQWSFALLDCRSELERELNEAIKHRDRLAEALRGAQAALNPLSGFTKSRHQKHIDVVRDAIRAALTMP